MKPGETTTMESLKIKIGEFARANGIKEDDPILNDITTIKGSYYQFIGNWDGVDYYLIPQNTQKLLIENAVYTNPSPKKDTSTQEAA